MTPNDAWILTFSGRQFWPLAPRVEDVCLIDIAHALSCICRFNGHVREFYSVAQHCVLASYLVHPRYAREALLHDAPEAYLCDLPRSLKQHEWMTHYRTAERRLEEVIADTFHLKLEEMGGVREVDNRLLLTECRDLMSAGYGLIDESRCYEQTIVPWLSIEAERKFLARFEELR